jgi:alpha-methylacyl-CoA racemase
MNASGTSAGPLSDIRILDLTRMYPGAFCTLLLADLGAEVMKVEGPGSGDGMRMMAPPGEFNPAHTALNRGKRSLVLDLRKPGAADVLRRLVQQADVVIEAHKPGQLDAMGVGYEMMRAANPRLVWCSLTGFGDHGINAAAPGHDLTYLGAAGLLGRLAQGSASPPAAPVSLPLAALMGAVGILAALNEVRRTGQGQRLDANMVDSAMWTMSEDVARAAVSPAPGWGTMAARNVYDCADGRQVTVASNEPRTWAKLCEALAVPELAAHRMGVDADEPVTARLTEVFRSKPASTWLVEPGLAGGVGPVNDTGDVLNDPQVTSRGSLIHLDDASYQVLANPIRFGSQTGAAASQATAPAPALGADTDDILRHAGFTPEEIQALRDAQAIG